MKLFWPINKTFEDALADLVHVQTNSPFDPQVILFTSALSKRFVQVRQQPEIVALGFWLRKSNIVNLENEFIKKKTDTIIRARGTVFHIAPSNVDTIFVYSWLLSLLAGNRNVVRISSKEMTGLNTLLHIILEELAKPEFAKIAAQTIICTYEHNENVTEKISALSHTRVVWGGDATIEAIRKIPLASMANELTFPDRFSLAVLNSNAIFELEKEKLVELAIHFFNDVFWFNQMACSSPRLIIWTGKLQHEAKEQFWPVFEEVIKNKQYELVAAVQVLKYTTALQLAADEKVNSVHNDTYFSRVKFDQLDSNIREVHCGGGLFYEYSVENLIDVIQIISDKDQTIAYFGIKREELIDFIESISSRGIDRIVPVGQALNFDGTWDGQNFLASFTREVVIK